jgi:hypothetical protein
LSAHARDTTWTLLQSSLDVAVPLWVDGCRAKDWTTLRERIRAIEDTFATSSEFVLFRSPKKGESAQAFNALAEAIAILSFVPGGVRTFGRHFENRHPDLTYTAYDERVAAEIV